MIGISSDISTVILPFTFFNLICFILPPVQSGPVIRYNKYPAVKKGKNGSVHFLDIFLLRKYAIKGPQGQED